MTEVHRQGQVTIDGSPASDLTATDAVTAMEQHEQQARGIAECMDAMILSGAPSPLVDGVL